MYSLRLLENGYITAIGDIEDEPVERQLDNKGILKYLGLPVQIEEGYTLYSYFNTLKNYPDLQEIDPWLSKYTDTFDKVKLSAISDFDEHEKIVIGYNASINTRTITNMDKICKKTKLSTGGTTIEIDIDNAEYKDDYRCTFYIACDAQVDAGIFSLLPLADILLLPIELQKEFTFECLQKQVPDELAKVYKDNSEITLFDFITTIIYEVSFHGDEESKKAIYNEICTLSKSLPPPNSNDE